MSVDQNKGVNFLRFFAYTESAHVEAKQRNQRLTQVIILIFTMGAFFCGHLRIATAQTVHIPDASLRTVIEAALGKKAGEDITQADMVDLVVLDAFESGIRDLTGLEFATNLVELRLGLNQISEVSSLRGLTKLTVLDLHRNQRISDVSPLKNLTNLVWLSLRGNQILDMSPLTNLTTLTFLHIGYNSISDISSLKNLAKLTFLNLDENRISDISLIKDLTNLTELHLDDNEISDISPIKDLTKLVFLNANDNEISDISPIKDLTNLTYLNLHGNRISDISPIKDLTNLKILRFHENEISDISPLKDLTKLEVLQLYVNQISDISPLKDLKELRKLDLHENEISDISPLKDLKDLMFLDLSGNYISDFSPIASLIGNLVKYYNSNQTILTYKPEDVNHDGIVNIIDLILVVSYFGNSGFADSANANVYPDVNGDGVVDVKDLVAVAADIDAAAAAPTLKKDQAELPVLTAENLERWVALAKQLYQDLGTRKGITTLEQLLVILTHSETFPETTALLMNYPNPFNPETWIPYQLSKSSQVNIYIHSVDGKLVRTLKLGHLPAGIYHSKSRAVYWDGRNELSESVASGVYFYTLTACDFTATGKMFIRK